MKGINKTLAEQMQVTDREIEQRKALLHFTQKDVDVLVSYKALIANRIDHIVEKFYDEQIRVPEIALLIGDVDTLRALTNAMRSYILELFEGHYDRDYVNRRLRIGKVHKRIGVEPKFYLSAIWLLQSILNDEIAQYEKKRQTNNEACHALQQSLHKLLMWDTQFVIDTYISGLVSEVAMAKEEMERYADSLEEVVAQRTKQLEESSRLDGLTKLYNQRAFHEHLRRELSDANRHKRTLSLIYFDLNGFKQLNDSQGHLAGDALLSVVGEIVLAQVREIDIACRYGGDEFAIILPETSESESEVISQRIVDTFRAHPNNCGISFSIGIASTGPEEFIEMDGLISKADALMYKSKALSKETPGFYTSIL